MTATCNTLLAVDLTVCDFFLFAFHSIDTAGILIFTKYGYKKMVILKSESENYWLVNVANARKCVCTIKRSPLTLIYIDWYA